MPARSTATELGTAHRLTGQEKLFQAIEEKKKAAAAEVRRQQQEDDAAEASAASETKVNVYGDPVHARPHISPRTKRLSQQHLKGEKFAGNYGQRLYQYGVTDFRKVRAHAPAWPSQLYVVAASARLCFLGAHRKVRVCLLSDETIKVGSCARPRR